MEYKITFGSTHDIENFNNQVNELLAEGWELYGEPKFQAYFAKAGHATGHEDTVIQALIRRTHV